MRIEMWSRRLPVLAMVGVVAACGSSTTQVVVPVAVTVSPHDTTIPTGGTVQLRATVTDAQGNTLDNLPMTYASTDTGIAKVSSSGLVAAGVKSGAVYVRASLSVLVDSALISVVDTSITRHLTIAGTPFAAAVSSKGAVYIGLLTQGTVVPLNLGSGTFGAPIPVGNAPSRIAFGSAGATAYVANQGSDNVSVINVAKDSVTRTIDVHGDPVPLAPSPDGQWLYVATNTNYVYKIALSSGDAIDSIALPQTSHFMLLAPSGNTLYVSTRDAGKVLEINTASWTVSRTFDVGGLTQGMALAPDGSELYVANQTLQRVDVVNLSTGTAVASVPLDGQAFDIALSPDGSKLYTSLILNSPEVVVVNRTGRSVARVITVNGSPACLGVDPGTGLVVVANQYGWVDVLH